MKNDNCSSTFMVCNQNDNFKDWIETYKSIIDWEVKFENNTGTEYQNILIDLKKDANKNFSLFIIKNYVCF